MGLGGLGARLTFAAGQAIQIGRLPGLRALTEQMDRVRRPPGSARGSQLRSPRPSRAWRRVAVKTFADFEKQIAIVASVSGATVSNRLLSPQRPMAGSRLHRGQAGEALEPWPSRLHGRQQIQTLRGVGARLRRSLDLGRASDILTSAMTSMRIPRRPSGLPTCSPWPNVPTDVNNSATFTYAAPTLAGLNISIEEGASLLGLLANAGLKGSMGGTSLVNMFEQLANRSDAANAFLERFHVSLTDAKGDFLPTADLVANVAAALEKVPGSAERAAITTELFGIRGKKAFMALAGAGPEAVRSLTEQMRTAGQTVSAEFPAAVGAAEVQAAKRLDNLSGRFTLFTSALQGVLIETGSLMGNVLGQALGPATAFLSDFAQALIGLAGGFANPAEQARLLGTTAGQVALGIRDAIATAAEVARRIKESIFDPLVGFFQGLSPEGKRLTTTFAVGAGNRACGLGIQCS